MVFPAISRRHVIRYPGQTADILRMAGNERFSAKDQVSLLEERFAEFIGAKHAMAVSSGRVSLEVILQSLELNKGSEVILPAYTYHSVPDCIRDQGLTPVFVDIDPTDNNIDPGEVKKKIGDKTAAVLATHIFGHPCRLDALSEICKKSGVLLLEDCAHTLGGKFNGRMVGTYGKASFFSFGATKVFNTYGGGIIVCDDDELAGKCRKILDFHRPPDKKGLFKTITIFSLLSFLTQSWPFTFTIYPVVWLMNSLNLDLLGLYGRTFKKMAESISVPVKFSNLQSLLALKNLDRIEEYNRQRTENAKTLMENLRPDIKRLEPVEGSESVWYFFAIGAENRKKASKELFKRGIDTGIHIMNDCAKLAGIKEQFPITEWWYEHSLQIPIHPPLTPETMHKVADVINDVIEEP